ncbi:hypothetical protein [Ligilactobacillus equi]|uniref:Uncharacterized protein n=1 Tax=Ligilactobacillus equi DSM 15833 = JCM 10991 TaxID=1423740 RepID=A0A0R1TSF3_9LACO|nr:hypothetical protein [Ligilactobacillus equi]KRL84310.1 hypothetical protein FC36_GL000233 [Ligilactobacillus equi DSM 15833 = JCM 10991]
MPLTKELIRDILSHSIIATDRKTGEQRINSARSWLNKANCIYAYPTGKSLTISGLLNIGINDKPVFTKALSRNSETAKDKIMLFLKHNLPNFDFSWNTAKPCYVIDYDDSYTWICSSKKEILDCILKFHCQNPLENNIDELLDYVVIKTFYGTGYDNPPETWMSLRVALDTFFDTDSKQEFFKNIGITEEDL